MTDPAASRRSTLLLGLMLVILLVATVPLFACQPPFLDCDLWGIAARVIRRGGVLERDFRFMAPPGFAWLRAGIDSLSGDRFYILKLVDVIIALTSITLIARWVGRTMNTAQRLATMFILTAFYLGTPEVCHCQPDPWMLLPTLAALHLRRRQMARMLEDGAGPGELLMRGALEGLLCGAACLIKPHAMVPMAAMWMTADLLVLIQQPRRWTRVILDILAIVLGGGIAVAAWVGWLVIGGGWEPLRESLRTLGPQYYAQSAAWYVRIPALLGLFLPFSAAHLIAIPVSIVAFFRGFRAAAGRRSDVRSRAENAIFAAFYLGWSFQEAFMQIAWMNHLLPPTMLALAIVIERVCGLEHSSRRRGILATIAVLTLIANPLLWPHKLRHWPRCFREPGSPSLHDAMANIPYYPSHIIEAMDPWTIITRLGLGADVAEARPRLYVTNWQDLDAIRRFLESQNVKDYELTCYHNTTSNLFLQMNLAPSTRTLWYDLDYVFFPGNRESSRRQLAESRQRFVVSDLYRIAIEDPPPPDPANPLALPDTCPPSLRSRYPWSEPIIFRAGRYAVHRVTGNVTPLTGLLPDKP